MYKRTYLTALLLMTFPLFLRAQGQSTEMADLMRSNGKIYVVVLVLATIFAGIIAFLIHLDRAIKKIERNKKS